MTRSRAGILTLAMVCCAGGNAVASTVPDGNLPAAAYAGLRRYLESIDESRLTDEDGLEVGECPLLGVDELGDVASLGGASRFSVDAAVVVPLTIARLGDRVSVQCSFSGGVEPGVVAADVTVLDLGVSPETARQLDQVMRGSVWELVAGPLSGELAGRCFARRDRDTCRLVWKVDDLAVLIEMTFGHGASDVATARLVFGALLERTLTNLAAIR